MVTNSVIAKESRWTAYHVEAQSTLSLGIEHDDIHDID